MKKTLKLRMIFWIWGITAILFALILYVNFTYSRDQELVELEETAQIQAGYYARKFEEVFTTASVIPRMTATQMSTGKMENRSSVQEFLKLVVEENKEIYGACIAFEPGVIKGGNGFAPYYHYKGEKIRFVQLDTPSYNYREQDWYKLAKEKGKPVWTEPYFDKGGGEVIMTTCSVPFYRNGRFAGVTTVDISLEQLTDEINRLEITRTGYGFIISPTGYFLSFPDKSKILKGSIFDYDKDLAARVSSGKPGFVKAVDPLHQKKSWIVYQPIHVANFTIGIVYPESEIMANIYMLQRNAAIVGVLGMMALLLIVILVANSITRPLSSLVEGVKNVARGDLNERLKVDTSTYEVHTLEMAFNKMVDNLRTRMDNLRDLTKEKENLFLSSIRALANSIEARDFYTRGHSERVTEFAVKIADQMGFDDKQLEKVRVAALLHDIGKINVPEDVLHKPGRLTEEEFNIIKQHPVQGAKILRPVKEFKEILPYLYHHHERFDKNGYPTGLGGEEIPLVSRILAVADSFDAMTSDRPYRKAMEVDKAVAELEKNSGTQFDPKVTDVFLDLVKNHKDWLKGVMEEQFYTSRSREK